MKRMATFGFAASSKRFRFQTKSSFVSNRFGQRRAKYSQTDLSGFPLFVFGTSTFAKETCLSLLATSGTSELTCSAWPV